MAKIRRILETVGTQILPGKNYRFPLYGETFWTIYRPIRFPSSAQKGVQMNNRGGCEFQDR